MPERARSLRTGLENRFTVRRLGCPIDDPCSNIIDAPRGYPLAQLHRTWELTTPDPPQQRRRRKRNNLRNQLRLSDEANRRKVREHGLQWRSAASRPCWSRCMRAPFPQPRSEAGGGLRLALPDRLEHIHDVGQLDRIDGHCTEDGVGVGLITVIHCTACFAPLHAALCASTYLVAARSKVTVAGPVRAARAALPSSIGSKPLRIFVRAARAASRALARDTSGKLPNPMSHLLPAIVARRIQLRVPLAVICNARPGTPPTKRRPGFLVRLTVTAGHSLTLRLTTSSRFPYPSSYPSLRERWRAFW